MAQRAHVRQTPQWDQRNGNSALRFDALGLRLQRVCAGVLDWCSFATPQHHITTTPQNQNAKTQPQVKKLNATMPQRADKKTHSNTATQQNRQTKPHYNDATTRAKRPTNPQHHKSTAESNLRAFLSVVACLVAQSTTAEPNPYHTALSRPHRDNTATQQDQNTHASRRAIAKTRPRNETRAQAASTRTWGVQRACRPGTNLNNDSLASHPRSRQGRRTPAGPGSFHKQIPISGSVFRPSK